jgi:hypothetical protein
MAKVTRYVKENATGGWDVVKAGHRRATAHGATKAGAISRATAMTRRDGGGEVVVLNQAGKMVASKQVTTSSAARHRASAS